jgi:hypothetical protein
MEVVILITEKPIKQGKQKIPEHTFPGLSCIYSLDKQRLNSFRNLLVWNYFLVPKYIAQF